MKMFTHLRWLAAALMLTQLWACSKHDVKPASGGPAIEFSTTTGEYKVKVGRDITLSAKVTNATNPVFSWKLDGRIISTSIVCPFIGAEAGEYFITLRVDAENGSMEQQVKVTVLDKLPPQINMPANLVAYAGKDNKLAATVAYADGAKYAWRLNGVVVGGDSVYVFNPSALGSNTLTLKVWNDDGEDLKSFGLVVLPPPVAQLFFDDGHYRLEGDVSTKRLSIPLGRSLVLAPVTANIPSPATFQWSVDGTAQASNTEYLTFAPQATGTYVITVSVPAAAVSAKVNVECVAAEGSYYRAPNQASRAIVTHAFEFTPAPGQFTNYQQGSSAEGARQDIQTSLDQNAAGYIAGLGAYGGYFITGFDHSVSDVAGKADIRIDDNAFAGWSEPGIVWVMQDENGNGLPDDTWYELKGSEAGKPETHERYAITYFKPSVPGADVLWIDNLGATGSVDYNQYHSQPYYFPMFINASSYTLTGTCLRSTMTIGAIETSPGYAWGYVDNYGDGSKKDFWLEDAVRADGTPAGLRYIDFVKVHTGMTGKGTAVGEISTEAGAPFDLNLNK
jgi:hypothetical protein